MKFVHSMLLVSLVAIGQSASAQSFLNEDFPGIAYMLIGDGKIKMNPVSGPVNIANLGKLNDKVDTIFIPSGYVMIGYEHTGYKGKARVFSSSGEIEGELDGKLSSVKFRKYKDLQCAIAYEHSQYRGNAFPFCLIDKTSVVPAPKSAWQYEISSLKVPQGLRLSFRGDDVDEPGRSYTENSPNIGSVSNDIFSSGVLETFDEQNFSMIFMSDPQFGWNGTKPNELAGHSDVFDNWEDAARAQAASMTTRRLIFLRKNHAGVVVNGDITNTGKSSQIDKFDEVYSTAYDNIYPGLGNHDYDNYVTSGDNKDVFRWLDRHISGLPSRTNYDLDGSISRNGTRDSYNGSFAYSWDIGDVHFVQLQNYPSFAIAGDYDVEFNIRKSLDWLEQDLATHGQNRRIVLNLHVFNASGFSKGGCTSPCSPLGNFNSERSRSTNTAADYERFREIVRNARVNAKDNMVLLFAGHIHHWAGNRKSYGTERDPSDIDYGSNLSAPSQYFNVTANGSSPATNVPVFFNGGAQWSKHLVVEFDPQGVTIQTVDSKYAIEEIIETVRVNNANPDTVN